MAGSSPPPPPLSDRGMRPLRLASRERHGRRPCLGQGRQRVEELTAEQQRDREEAFKNVFSEWQSLTYEGLF